MQFRDRVRELRRVPAADLRPNPKNWRTHPTAQRDALRGVLAEVGYAGALVARELDDGSLELIDGHLRAETTPDALVPVLVLDVTGDEADKLLTVLDPLAAMAETNRERLSSLAANVATQNSEVRALLDRLMAESAAEHAQFVPPECDVPAQELEAFQIVVECRSEDEQRQLYERLHGEGFACRLLVL